MDRTIEDQTLIAEALTGKAASRKQSMVREAPWRWLAFGLHIAVFSAVAFRGLFRAAQFVGPNLFWKHAEIADYAFHDYWRPASPGYLFRFGTRSITLVLGQSDMRIGAMITCSLAYGLFGLALYETYRRTASGKPLLSPRLALGMSVCLAIMESPAALWGWTRFSDDGIFLPLYLPFVPTTLVSLGLNLFLMLAVADLVCGRTRPNRRWLIPVLVVAAAVAKPTLLPVLTAAALIVTLWDDRTRTRTNPLATRRIGDVIRLVAIPAAAVIFLQLLTTIYKVQYPSQGYDDRGGWTILPLAELRRLQALTPLFFLCFLFPIVAIVILRRPLLADRSVSLATIATTIGLALALTLTRTGSKYDGDMLQPLEAAMAIMIILMVRRLVELQRSGGLPKTKLIICLGALAPYLVAGLASYSCHVGLGCPAL